MVHYRRSRVAGGTFFFTVNLHDRRRALLTEHADALRNIVRDVRTELLFVIDAMVVLPDHWHAVWTLHRYVKDGLFPADWACAPLEGEFGE